MRNEAEKERSRPLGPRDLVKKPGGERMELPKLPLYVFAQDQLYLWAQRLLTAELASRDKKADQLAAYEAHLLRMKEIEDSFTKGAKEDKTDTAAAEAKFHRLDAEIMLERARGK